MNKNQQKSGSRRRYVITAILICLGIIVLIPLVCYGIVHSTQRGEAVYIDNIDSLTAKDAIIVPAAAIADGSITAKGEDRLKAAIKLYNAGLARIIIVSGGDNEVAPMVNYLIRKDIPYEALVSDACGVDTYDTIARAKEKFADMSVYLCTQQLYSSRSGYLMDRLGLDGRVVCVDARYYSNVGRNLIREFLAATKAVFEPVVLQCRAKTAIEDEDYIEAKKPVMNSHFIYEEDVEVPDDCRTVDINPDDGYDVHKAVAYARQYAFDNNTEYGQFEYNCTNFVSQCLVAGGIKMRGQADISQNKRWNISGDDTEWFSRTEKCESDGLKHYSMSDTFVKTDEFFKYFTEKLGYEFTEYDNSREGNIRCFEEMAAGDVLVLYNEAGEVEHLGLISGIGDMNAYYCGNTKERRDFSAFTIDRETYSGMGILHMSKKKGRNYNE